MSIRDIGYLKFFEHPCIYVQDDMDYIIVPQDEKTNLLPYVSRKGYTLEFSAPMNRKGIVSVKRGSSGLYNHVRLELNYIAKVWDSTGINEFIMVGNEIDTFFSPLEYYFPLKHRNKYIASDLLYDQEIAAKYKFEYKKSLVEVDLIFGNVLSYGIRSDLTMHPQLVVRLAKPQSADYVFNISQVIIKFLQFVMRKRKYNLKGIELFQCINGQQSRIGYLFSSLYNADLRPASMFDASFRCYGNKIGNLLSLIASDNKFPINHLNEEWSNPYEYTAERFGALCSALEYECGKAPELYQNAGAEFDDIREKIVAEIESVKAQSVVEQGFQKDAIERIKNLGTQRGFSKKILAAYEVNISALENSMESILFREKSLSKVARQLSNLRGKVLHNEMGYQFDEKEIEAIRFLEILQFVMTLRRAEYADNEIEIIIGALYHCNNLYWDSL